MSRSFIAAGILGVILTGGLGTMGSRAADQTKSAAPAQHHAEMEKCLKELAKDHPTAQFEYDKTFFGNCK